MSLKCSGRSNPERKLKFYVAPNSHQNFCINDGLMRMISQQGGYYFPNGIIIYQNLRVGF